MYRTVLVPLDGSNLSECALPIAVCLARATKASMVLVRTAWVPDDPGLDPIASQMWAAREARAYLETVAANLSAFKIPVETFVPFALPHEGILREIELRHADIVVMSTHGADTPEANIFGSVARAVVAASRVPVLLIRKGLGSPTMMPKPNADTLLVPLDGSPFAEAVVPYAVELAQTLNWRVELMHIVVEPSQESPLLREHTDTPASAEHYLAHVAERLLPLGLDVQLVVRPGIPAPTVLEESESARIGAVVMATHGHTGMREMLFGSVAQDVLHFANTPLLLVRPPDLAAGMAGAANLTAQMVERMNGR
ncbi:MAG: universal stress protein [Anaerolineae bacterium]